MTNKCMRSWTAEQVGFCWSRTNTWLLKWPFWPWDLTLMRMLLILTKLRLTNQWAPWPSHSSLPICKWEQTSSLSSGKGWAPDIDWVPVLICSDVRAHIYKGVASCHLLRSSSSFPTLSVPCSLPSLLFTFKPFRCLLPLSSSSLLSDFLFQFYSPHTLNSLPIVRKVQRNLRPRPLLQCLTIPLSLRLHSLWATVNDEWAERPRGPDLRSSVG